VIPNYQYPDANHYKAICDWPIYLTASAGAMQYWHRRANIKGVTPLPLFTYLSG